MCYYLFVNLIYEIATINISYILDKYKCTILLNKLVFTKL